MTHLSNIFLGKKAMLALFLAWGIAPVLLFIEKHLLAMQSEFMTVAVLVIIDTVTGAGLALRSGNFKSRVFRTQSFPKIASYIGMLLLAYVLDTAVAKPGVKDALEYTATMIRSFVFISESISILENFGRLNPSMDIGPIIRKLKNALRSADNKKLQEDAPLDYQNEITPEATKDVSPPSSN